jgi:hypothetical protein
LVWIFILGGWFFGLFMIHGWIKLVNFLKKLIDLGYVLMVGDWLFFFVAVVGD